MTRSKSGTVAVTISSWSNTKGIKDVSALILTNPHTQSGLRPAISHMTLTLSTCSMEAAVATGGVQLCGQCMECVRAWMAVLFGQPPPDRRRYPRRKALLLLFPSSTHLTRRRLTFTQFVIHYLWQTESVFVRAWATSCKTAMTTCLHSNKCFFSSSKLTGCLDEAVKWAGTSCLHLPPIVQFAWRSVNSVLHRVRQCACVCLSM